MNKRIITALVAAGFSAGLLVPAAQADNMKDAVTSKYKSTVTSTSGECVRTKWSSSDDICAPKKAPAPAPKPVPVATIAKDQRTVYFDFGKDALRPDARTTLDQLIGLIRASGMVTKIHVVGYVDAIGGESKGNLALSQRRADAVKAYLASALQIPSDANVQGLGVSHTAECKKEKGKKRIACLQPDRRVEVELEYKKESH